MKSLLTKTMVSTDDKMPNGLSFSFDPPCGQEAWELEGGLGIRNNIKKYIVISVRLWNFKDDGS